MTIAESTPPQRNVKHRGSWNPLSRYTRWLHTMWPAGTVERLPEVQADGSTNIPGVFVVGDLTGIPLLKFSADTGARAAQKIAGELKGAAESRGSGDGAQGSEKELKRQSPALDLIIIGGGVSGMAAALEAKKANLRFEILEGTEPFSTIINFPKAKPIYTYPTEMVPAGDLQFRAQVKEPLVDEIREQTREIQPRIARAEKISRRGGMLEVALADNQPAMLARRVIVAIGRSGNFRRLNVPGEDLGKVFNRLHDPKEYAGKNALVVGGGDSALETAIAIAECGGNVTLSYRKPEFSRPKPDNVEKLNRLKRDPMADVQVEKPSSDRVNPAMGGYMGAHRSAGRIDLLLGSKVKAIRDNAVEIVNAEGKELSVANDVVFTMIGREAPLDFFRRSGLRINGEWTPWRIISMILFLAICVVLYSWKSNHPHEFALQQFCVNPAAYIKLNPGTPLKAISTSDQPLFPFNLKVDAKKWAGSERNLLYTLRVELPNPAFYYSLMYCTCVTVFGIRRMRRRRTPYVKWQTISLMAVQWLPLFILPEIILPWMGRNGYFEVGHHLRGLADSLFETYDGGLGHERAYWRAYGLILAWPLNVYNIFTDKPLWAWIWISIAQTFVLIPGIIYFWGKGAYCGWICSCGALAETMGDAHRQKMPHGPFWNRFNMLGQALLLFAFVVLALRIIGWSTPAPAAVKVTAGAYDQASNRTTLTFDPKITKDFAGKDSRLVWAPKKQTILNVAAGTDFVAEGNQAWLKNQPVSLYSARTAFHEKIVGWYEYLFEGIPFLNYSWFVDIFWGGILGVGLYFWFSGRVWCRFACPLAALMHIYARFSRFRILADKKKCISCNVCTSVCHQGIDIMNFANKGLAMRDPECVRCSACVQMCPTGVLSFGQMNRKDRVVSKDPGFLAASPVLMREIHVNGKKLAV